MLVPSELNMAALSRLPVATRLKTASVMWQLGGKDTLRDTLYRHILSHASLATRITDSDGGAHGEIGFAYVATTWRLLLKQEILIAKLAK